MMTRKVYEVWALSSGGRVEIVATFEDHKSAHEEAARLRWIYKSVFVDFGFYTD